MEDISTQLKIISDTFVAGTINGGEQARDLIADFVLKLGQKLSKDKVIDNNGMILLSEKIREIQIELFDPVGVIVLAFPGSDKNETSSTR